jgi:hypothetical protein
VQPRDGEIGRGQDCSGGPHVDNMLDCEFCIGKCNLCDIVTFERAANHAGDDHTFAWDRRGDELNDRP